MKSILTLLLVSACLLGAKASAFELGMPTVANKSGEPLVVRIPIYNLDIDGYSTLAGSIEGYHEAIDNLTYRVRRYGDDFLFIIRSGQPIYEPFEATVVLTYRNERAEKKILIDPAIESTSMRRVEVQETLVQVPSATTAGDVPAPYVPEPAAVNERAKLETYLVKEGDTISHIAERYRSELGGTIHQRAVALYRFNVKKFFKENINILPADTVLVIPPSGEIGLIEKSDARRAFFQLVEGDKVDLTAIVRNAIPAFKNELTAAKVQLADLAEEQASVNSQRVEVLDDIKQVAADVNAGADSDDIQSRLSALEDQVRELAAQAQTLSERLDAVLAKLEKRTAELLATN